MQQRIYQADDGQWYYRARGNQDVGPFESYHGAEQSLHKLLRAWSANHNPRLRWPRHLSPGRLLRRSAARHP